MIDEKPQKMQNRKSVVTKTDLDKKIEAAEKGQPIMAKSRLKKKNKFDKSMLIISLVAIGAGVLTGYGLNTGRVSSGSDGEVPQVAGEKIKAGDVFGVEESETFNTNAEGFLVKAEIVDEGTHRLLRPGGASQTVNLISSITDLDKFTNMQIKVHGETFKSQKGAWFMDVGRVEVIDPEAEAPLE
jgi:hypothetical protein